MKPQTMMLAALMLATASASAQSLGSNPRVVVALTHETVPFNHVAYVPEITETVDAKTGAFAGRVPVWAWRRAHAIKVPNGSTIICTASEVYPDEPGTEYCTAWRITAKGKQ